MGLHESANAETVTLNTMRGQDGYFNLKKNGGKV